MTDLRYYGQDDLERLDEIAELKGKTELRDQLITALVVIAYGIFLAGLFWAMSVKPAVPL